MSIYQDVFFRALDGARGRRTIATLRELRRSQYWEPERLAGWQLERLNHLLSEAKEHSPHYVRALQDVRVPLDSLEGLETLPVLTKETARAEYGEIPNRALPKSRFIPNRTGGSTGEPLHYFWDRQGRDWNRASVYRSAEWAGVALGERTVEMSGSHFDRTRAATLSARLTARLMRYRVYSVAFLTEDLLQRYYEGVARWRPTSLWGYASALATFAQYVLDRGPAADLSSVRSVITSSETLRPGQREVIERAFGPGSVFDNYGSREMYMAAECPEHHGYHVHGEVVLLEVVDGSGRPCAPGQRGRILLTDLSNHAFPFIRYEVGDVGALAAPSECPCGVRLPMLANVEGRIADMIVLRDRVLTPPNITILMSDIRGLDAYQVRQDAVDRLEVHLVPGADYRPEVAQYVRSSLEQMVEGQARVVVREVPDITVPESGKRRYIVSAVSGDHL